MGIYHPVDTPGSSNRPVPSGHQAHAKSLGLFTLLPFQVLKFFLLLLPINLQLLVGQSHWGHSERKSSVNQQWSPGRPLPMIDTTCSSLQFRMQGLALTSWDKTASGLIEWQKLAIYIFMGSWHLVGQHFWSGSSKAAPPATISYCTIIPGSVQTLRVNSLLLCLTYMDSSACFLCSAACCSLSFSATWACRSTSVKLWLLTFWAPRPFLAPNWKKQNKINKFQDKPDWLYRLTSCWSCKLMVTRCNHCKLCRGTKILRKQMEILVHRIISELIGVGLIIPERNYCSPMGNLCCM